MGAARCATGSALQVRVYEQLLELQQRMNSRLSESNRYARFLDGELSVSSRRSQWPTSPRRAAPRPFPAPCAASASTGTLCIACCAVCDAVQVREALKDEGVVSTMSELIEVGSRLRALFRPRLLVSCVACT
jgi:hypothetical protein